MATIITRKAHASYRVDLPNGWYELGLEELGVGYALVERESNPNPIRPILRWFIAQSLEEADRKNYERAKEKAELAA